MLPDGLMPWSLYSVVCTLLLLKLLVWNQSWLAPTRSNQESVNFRVSLRLKPC